MKKFSLITLCAILALISIMPVIAYSQAKDSTFTDTRNGKKYKAVRIGKQTWMAENLNYTTDNSWCYDNKESNCNIYGRLYSWADAKIACPTGWHIPADWDYKILGDSAGGEIKAGGSLKTTDSTYWKKPNKNATNSFGFSALPGGYRNEKGEFGNLGYYGLWWTNSEDGGTFGFNRYIHHSDTVFPRGMNSKKIALSVRCLKD